MPAYINVCSFHWILLIIRVDEGVVEIMDPLGKDQKLYDSLLTLLQR
jgi:Ulp1 family protease